MKFACALLISLYASHLDSAQEPEVLALEITIPLGQIKGRIDHLAVDLGRQRLFVAELGNDSVGVVDLKSTSLSRRLTGQREPQGIVFVAATDELYVANGGDGSVRVYRGTDLSPAGITALGKDADNLRLDPLGRFVIAGHSDGGLAVLDIRSHRLVADIALGAHPEGFQLSRDGKHAYVNLPARHEISVVDMSTHLGSASWPATDSGANFPMALEPDDGSVWIAFRGPPKLARFSAEGTRTLMLETCADSDDLFFDNLRHWLYVICGSGHIDVLEQRGSQYVRLARVATFPGARTGLYVPELDRLFIAVRATSNQPAAILVFRPSRLAGAPAQN